MKKVLSFTNLDPELIVPFEELQSELGFTMAKEQEAGIEVAVSNTSKGLMVTFKDGKAELKYQNKAALFRGLGLLIEAIKEDREVELKEQPSFKHLTYMQDNSRNAVSNIDSVKKLIRQLALMGYDSLMLYTEDTYEIEGYPFFGYQRGRFLKQELRLLDTYGKQFGIELVPCIQTLAHLNAIFKWNCFDDIRDLGDILLCGNEKTYKLIEAMVKTCAEVFTSRRINIGMDEAEMLGLGKYLKLHGYTKPAAIMAEHLHKVLEICEKYGLQAMMWSDMFFKMLPDNADYYNVSADITNEIKEKIPENVELIYWDYYSRDKSKYDKMISRHKQLSDRIGFAGGAWKWQGFAPLLHHSMLVSRLALQSCIEYGIKDVIVTGWGDNGSETANFAVGPVLQLYAEVCYNGNDREEAIAKRLYTCTHMDLADYMELDSVNLTPDNPSPGRVSVGPAKYLFYQDVLQGLYDTHVDPDTYPAHYHTCYETLSGIAEKENEYNYIFNTLAKLAHVLELKCDMGIRLKAAYDRKDTKALAQITNVDCPELLRRIEEFHEAFRYQWYKENKPFGFDVQDIRIGGLKERIKAVTWRIQSYLDGKTDRIEELEEERLVLDRRDNPGYSTLPLWHNDWQRAVTASVL
ncbi:MAG: beta-N-acetylhexosaminidase [Lachnospiraceae bacterium]|nr:beta-N-acetylhexosaminidase [Lachnospiraceae bacterium]